MSPKGRESRKAGKGEHMIELKVRFWTNGLGAGKGEIWPKHAWPSGVVRVEANQTHGIRAKKPIPFNSLMHLPAVIEKVLINQGITLHLERRMSRYFAPRIR